MTTLKQTAAKRTRTTEVARAHGLGALQAEQSKSLPLPWLRFVKTCKPRLPPPSIRRPPRPLVARPLPSKNHSGAATLERRPSAQKFNKLGSIDRLSAVASTGDI